MHHHVHVEYNTFCLSITRNNSIMYVAVVHACVCGEGHLL